MARAKLTQAEAEALLLVRGGADVTGYTLALTYRAIQQKAPEFIDIGPVEGNHGDGVGTQPYFGCIATTTGIAAAEHTLDRLKRLSWRSRRAPVTGEDPRD